MTKNIFNISSQRSIDTSKFTEYVRPEFVDTESAFKKISKHPRFLSDWASSTIVVDVSHKQSSTPTIKVIELHNFYLPANAPVGPFFKPVRLLDFPNLVTLIKLGLNAKLHVTTSQFSDAIIKEVSFIHRFLAWSFMNGVYEISVLDNNDYREFSKQFSANNWYGLLDVENKLFTLSLAARADKTIAEKLVTFHQKDVPSISDKVLHKLIGIPLNRKMTPEYFVKDMCEILDLEFNPKSRAYIELDNPPSESTIKEVLRSINRLSNLPDAIDKPKATPYPKLGSYVRKICKARNESRTPNLTIDDAVKLLQASLSFVYDYAPFIIDGLKMARSELLAKPENAKRDTVLDQIIEGYAKLVANVDIPFKTISGLFQRRNTKSNNEGVPTLGDLALALQTSCIIIIGINHGRRKNEIIGGNDLPYGIYQGCVIKEDGPLDIYKIDLYVEKTIQDWCTFHCNRLVADAVSTLERLNECFYPENAVDSNVGHFCNPDSRKRKLFRWRNLTPNSLQNESRWSSFDYSKHSPFLIEFANVKPNCLDHRTHVFRRFFSLIYYYRYDNPILIDLKIHLKHRSLSMTQVYVTDPAMRKDADRINNLYVKEHADFAESHQSIGIEYVTNKINDILSEQPTGGGFTVTVHRLFRHLLRRVEFRILDDESQVRELANELSKLGCSPTIDTHGVCLLTPALRQSKAKCFSESDNVAHTENACLNVCMNCCYHFDNSNYLDALSQDAEELLSKSQDFSLTMAERLAYEDSHKEFAELIELERKVQICNAEKIKCAKANAYLVWGLTDRITNMVKHAEKAEITETTCS